MLSCVEHGLFITSGPAILHFKRERKKLTQHFSWGVSVDNNEILARDENPKYGKKNCNS